MISPLFTTVERSFEAEEARVGSSNCVDGVCKASFVIETTVEVTDTAPKILVGHPTTKLLPESETETTEPPTVDDARLSSPYSLEKVDIAEHPQAAEGARSVNGIGSLGTAT